MSKASFLEELRKGLNGLPQEDVEERIAFYSEMIDDRMEEGLSEEEATAEIGPISKVVSQILEDIPLKKLVRERMKPKRRLSGWEIALLVLGFPVWFPLIVAGAAVLFSLYAVIWSLVIVLWAVWLAFAASSVALLAAAVLFAVKGRFGEAGLALGAALMLAGLAILLFFVCIAASKGMARFTKKTVLWIKSLFVGKEK